MASPTRAPYILDRGFLGTARLYLQYFLSKARAGYTLHPKIEASLKETVASPNILDLGTGTGIWATELAKEYPNATVTGLDISDKQFPPEGVRLANVSFSTYSFFDPVPEEFVGTFDVVHASYILVALYKGGRNTVIEHMNQFLKPGGWIQWREPINPPTVIVDPQTMQTGGELPMLTVAQELLGYIAAQDWTQEMPKVLADVGHFFETEAHTPGMDPALLHLETQLICWNSHEFFTTLAENLGTSDAKKRVAEVLAYTDELVEAGKMLHWRFTIGIGRKPF